MIFICIVNLHLHDHPTYKLIIAANRDEFLKRPTALANYWDDHPEILAGRDLEAMGTWMGITKSGRFATLTNYRDPTLELANKVSRGEIVTDFLTSDQSADDFLKALQQRKDKYNGFNVIVGTIDELTYYSNQQDKIIHIPPGTHSVSNHLLNTPWPKVTKATEMLSECAKSNQAIDPEDLFHLLNNQEIASNDMLPNTGVSLELEQQLSPIFIQVPDYGTRTSTVILVTKQNEVTFIERTFKQDAAFTEQKYTFKL